jgi:AcrR family transcriptional regulator
MGRPREFDIDKAVDTAVDLFWRNGYDKTSLEDLTGALKITPPSFYFAFGNKERLFKQALRRYMADEFERFERALRQPTSREVVASLFEGFAETFTNPAHPGCFCVNSTAPCAEGPDPIRHALAQMRAEFSTRLRKRFREARASKELPTHANPEALARFVMVVGWGMAIAAQSGATLKDLRRTAAVALEAWPT